MSEKFVVEMKAVGTDDTFWSEDDDIDFPSEANAREYIRHQLVRDANRGGTKWEYRPVRVTTTEAREVLA